MPEVDPDDDALDRWVLQHFRFDPSRNERRNVTLAAFDDEDEFRRHFDVASAELAARRAAGETGDDERILGAYREAGYSARAAQLRAERPDR